MMDEDYSRNSLSQGVENLLPPSGFMSEKSFRLRKVEQSENYSLKAFHDSIKTKQTEIGTLSGTMDIEMMESTCRQRPWIVFDQSNDDSLEFDSMEHDLNLPPQSCLPKGVTHGCPDCSDCLKVTARWRPEDARTAILEEAPVFYPTEEEFADTLHFIEKIRPRAESCGICRIVPPASWLPPCLLKEKEIWESSPFLTHNQQIDGLQKNDACGQLLKHNGSIQSKRRGLNMGLEHGCSKRFFVDPGESDKKGSKSGLGREFTLKAFKSYADDFKFQYFSSENKVTSSETNSSMLQEQWEPSVDQVEGEYRRIIENPTEQIEVLCGDSLRSSSLGSGFPVSSRLLIEPGHADHMNSGWNLNNLRRLPGSLLSFDSFNTCSMLLPRVHVGMCFSTACWRVEEHHLPLLCYLHLGAPKIWYGIPGRYIDKFEAAMKSIPEFFVEQKRSHRGLVGPPLTTLKREGIPVYRCTQNPGEFVLVLPGACHSGFNCGFNITEEANFAPLDWLPYGYNATELYSVEGRKTLISFDRLLLGAAIEAVKAQWELSLCRKETKDNLRWKDACGKNGILAQTFKSRIKSEGLRREYLTAATQIQEVNGSFDAVYKRECSICLYDLHLSAAGCSCSADRYSCLTHAKQLCSCAWGDKFFVVRYKMGNLNLLLEALEGKLSAVYKWAKENLGLAVHSYVAKNNVLQSQPGDNSPHSSKGHQSEDADSPNTVKASISRIKAEIRAHLLLSKTLKRVKENEKVMEPEDAVKDNGVLTKSDTGMPTEVTASKLQPISSNEFKGKENTSTSTSTPTVVLNERGDGLIFSLKLESSENLSGSSVSSFSESDDCQSDSGI